ncbi:uncharacterized protein BDCG_04955 [Blastomyces dermatitidis ER-3]|uniref:Uncharacterized protein n=1 Tax=Ajellomyces dermatitidis (strain ER-3 / ATCC MYA-2586) TaxID=559297 RepID=A0ABP2EZT9_AJEDR|nr:uncharacterized protein BDCG_04955 [Blastomyces dermatitidis ER-3]EEQ89835.2 hypothetical protein BDCG_04955 [Blastomyces dermatitidis ER-3]EQL37916.1 hypothetical protein BDFG_00941 [Blastomyces dermatitidis ATCC 26199]
MYSYTETQKFLILVPQEESPMAQSRGVNSTTPTPLSSQIPSFANEISATPVPQKITRSPSASSTASTDIRSGFLRLGV